MLLSSVDRFRRPDVMTTWPDSQAPVCWMSGPERRRQSRAVTSDAVTVLKNPQNFAPLRLFFSSERRKAYLFRAPSSPGNVSAPSTHKPRRNHKPERPRLFGSGISSGATASRRTAAARQLQPLILPPGTSRPPGRQQRRSPAQVRD